MKFYKNIVIGSGPSGLICASTLDGTTLLIEKNESIGGKIKVSGGGRCNLTNNKNIQGIIDHVPRNGKFLFSTLNNFGPIEIKSFFETRGLELKEEDHNRVFPKDNKSQSVIQVLHDACVSNSVDIKVNCSAKTITFDEDQFIINNNFKCENLIISTGGKTYFNLGTTGDGYEFAKYFGHTVTDLFPTECALVSNDVIIQSKIYQGLSIKDCKVELLVDGKSKKTITNDILITHFGLSGPAAFHLSYFVHTNIQNGKKCEIKLNFNQNTPKKLIEKCEEEFVVFSVTETKGWTSAFVTAGGISLKEINPQTFESKIKDSLYFIGEVIDINAFTGGYNLTSCFSQGLTCAKNINEKNQF